MCSDLLCTFYKIRDTGNNFRRIRYYKATTSIRSITWMKAVPSALLLGCGNGDAHVLILNETAPVGIVCIFISVHKS